MTENQINDNYYDEDSLHEECGVFGAYDFDGGNVASTIYYGLFALQHRGQESCGIAVSDTEGPKGKVLSYKDMGLVNEVFDEEKLDKLKGNIGVGHVRYSTAGSSVRENAWRACPGTPPPMPPAWSSPSGRYMNMCPWRKTMNPWCASMS